MQKVAAIAITIATISGPAICEELAVPTTFSIDAVTYFEVPDSYSIRTDASGITHVTIRFHGRKFLISYQKTALDAESFLPSMWFQVRTYEVVSGRNFRIGAELQGGNLSDPATLELLVTYDRKDFSTDARVENILIDYLWGVQVCQVGEEDRVCLPFHVLE